MEGCRVEVKQHFSIPDFEDLKVEGRRLGMTPNSRNRKFQSIRESLEVGNLFELTRYWC